MQSPEINQTPPPRKPTRPFDSLAFAKRLQAGGVFSRERAECLSEQLINAIDDGTSDHTAWIKQFISGGFTQQQAATLVDYVSDYAGYWHDIHGVGKRD
jgi:hypothetical protein